MDSPQTPEWFDLSETKSIIAAWARGAVDANSFFDWFDDAAPVLVAEVEALRGRCVDQERHSGQALLAWEETKAALAVSEARTTQLKTENAQLRTLLHEWSILYHEPIPDSLTLATRDALGGE